MTAKKTPADWSDYLRELTAQNKRWPRRLPYEARPRYSYSKKSCRCCGKPFWVEHRFADPDEAPFFCSPACRTEDRRQRRLEERHEAAQAREIDYGRCTVCGEPLQSTARRTSRRYCSPACRQAAYRERNG
jgi:hypothetical protein